MIPEDRMIPIIITCIGEQRVFKILKDLCDPVLLAEHTYEKLCPLFNNSFALKISVFHKREEFYSVQQTTQESVNEWYVRLKNSLLSCKLKKNLNEVLRDKFVIGFKDGLIKNRLCKEELDVELKKLVELAIKRESTVNASFSDCTGVHIMGKTVSGDKRATEKGNKMFKKQWLFKEGSSKRSIGEGKTRKSTKKCF